MSDFDDIENLANLQSPLKANDLERELNNNYKDNKPSAPPADENGFIVVPEQQQQQQTIDIAVGNALEELTKGIGEASQDLNQPDDDIANIINELSSRATFGELLKEEIKEHEDESTSQFPVISQDDLRIEETTSEVQQNKQEEKQTVEELNHTEVKQTELHLTSEVVIPENIIPEVVKSVKQEVPIKPEVKPVEVIKPEVKKQESINKTTESKSTCLACPYYLLGGNYFKNLQLPVEVKDLLLWKNPKYTGAVFSTLLVLLSSFAAFSLLTVIGTLFLVAISLVGVYKLYLSIVFRIKGTYDDTFDKLTSGDLSLPKGQIQEFARLLDTDVNNMLKKLKSIVLWDNVITSGLSFIGFYFVYCIGSIFNTLTLVILALVFAFTLPKVYQVYQKQIDEGLNKAADFSHKISKQILAKLPPFLHKKKSQ